MTFSDRLAKFAEADFISFSVKFLHTCDSRMVRMTRGEEKPYAFGGSLSFGWDWRTFGVYYPMMANRWHQIVAEGKRRNLKTISYTLKDELAKRRPKQAA